MYNGDAGIRLHAKARRSARRRRGTPFGPRVSQARQTGTSCGNR
jgi:hypothetical protein